MFVRIKTSLVLPCIFDNNNSCCERSGLYGESEMTYRLDILALGDPTRCWRGPCRHDVSENTITVAILYQGNALSRAKLPDLVSIVVTSLCHNAAIPRIAWHQLQAVMRHESQGTLPSADHLPVTYILDTLQLRVCSLRLFCEIGEIDPEFYRKLRILNSKEPLRSSTM